MLAHPLVARAQPTRLGAGRIGGALFAVAVDWLRGDAWFCASRGTRPRTPAAKGLPGTPRLGLLTSGGARKLWQFDLRPDGTVQPPPSLWHVLPTVPQQQWDTGHGPGLWPAPRFVHRTTASPLGCESVNQKFPVTICILPSPFHAATAQVT